MKKILLLCGYAIFILSIPTISLVAPEVAGADIYQWEDEDGTVNFTDTPSNIPKQHRSRRKVVLRGPSESGRPGLTTIESSRPGPAPTYPEPPPSSEFAIPLQESPRAQIEQLQAKIAAKEQFIESIDRKRSHALNPLGNRFVSPEDLELYKKYSEELPQDRQRLKELQ